MAKPINSAGAYEAAAEKYQPMLDSLARQYYAVAKRYADYTDIDDFRQEAQIALMRALDTYDRTQSGVTFGLYAKICVKNRLTSILRKLRRTARLYAACDASDGAGEDNTGEEAVGAGGSADSEGCTAAKVRAKSGKIVYITRAQKPDEASADYPPGLYGDPELALIEAENYKHLTDMIGCVLNGREKRVLDLYVGGASYKEIAKRLNVSEKSVDNALYRIKAKLRKSVLR